MKLKGINGTGADSKNHGRTHYGVSFNISPYYLVNGKRWQKWDNEQQKEILEHIFCTEYHNITGQQIDDYIFELTERKNIHLHALAFCTEKEIKLIQKVVNEKYKYPKDPIDRVFHYSETLVHRSFWTRYMSKDQNKETTNEPDQLDIFMF